jgi:hypothetical protein
VKDCLVFGQQRFVDDLSLGLWRDDSGGTDGTYPIKSGMLRNVACLIHWATFHLSPSAGPPPPHSYLYYGSGGLTLQRGDPEVVEVRGRRRSVHSVFCSARSFF